MNDKNTQYLLKKYPMLLKQHKLPMTQTAMCWLFECGNGWFELIDELCSKIMEIIKRDKLKGIEFTQVKEKFGLLRVYIQGATEEIYRLIDEYEEKSSEVCEVCGEKGKLRDTEYWLRTECDNCRKVRLKEDAE